eukprot:1652580-Rhodomonas_salina.1
MPDLDLSLLADAAMKPHLALSLRATPSMHSQHGCLAPRWSSCSPWCSGLREMPTPTCCTCPSSRT